MSQNIKVTLILVASYVFFPWGSVSVSVCFVVVYPGTHRPTQAFRVGETDAEFPASEDEEEEGTNINEVL